MANRVFISSLSLTSTLDLSKKVEKLLPLLLYPSIFFPCSSINYRERERLKYPGMILGLSVSTFTSVSFRFMLIPQLPPGQVPTTALPRSSMEVHSSFEDALWIRQGQFLSVLTLGCDLPSLPGCGLVSEPRSPRGRMFSELFQVTTVTETQCPFTRLLWDGVSERRDETKCHR